MQTTRLRRVGGSLMLAVPRALLEPLELQPGASLGISIQDGRLVIEPRPRPHYTLDDLLGRCHPRARRSRGRGERQWLRSPSVGRELI